MNLVNEQEIIMLFSGQTSKGTRCVNMQLFIFICLAYLHLSDTSCIPVEKLDKASTAPLLNINIREFPDEYVVPVGYNLAIVCIASTATNNTAGQIYSLPYAVELYFNEKPINKCGGKRSDREERKVCSYVIRNSSKSDSGEYRCYAKNSYICTVGSIQLDFKDPVSPTFSLDLPRQVTVPSTSNFNLTCHASGIPLPNITWFKNGSRLLHPPISTVKGHSMLRFESIKREDRGVYWCEANNFAGWKRSATATVTVLWKPFFTMHPQDNTVKLKSGTAVVALKCAAEGLPRPVISWLRNNSTVINDTVTINGSVSTLNLVFRTIKDEDPKYMCVATNVVGRTYSSEAALTFATKSPSSNKASADDGMSQLLWPSIIVGIVAILVVVMIVIVMKQKWWMRANSQRNWELVKTQQEFIELQKRNGEELINQLRNSHSTSTITADSTQEGTLSTMDGQEEAIDNELYLQGMDTENRDWEVPRNRLVITGEKLGGGEFGIVTKGVYSRTDGNRLPVAVKTLKENADQQERMALIRELAILIHVGRHPNIVSLVGACTFEEPLCVVIELVSGGSLDNILRSSRVQPERDIPSYSNIWSRLNERELLKIALDVSNGMKHLESKQCVHRDLASRNVLVGGGLVAKVADFGMSRDISRDGHYIKTLQGRIPWLWMSIEALKGISTIKGDVWSFGVVLWEIVTLGELPYRGVTGLVELHELLLEGARLGKPAHCSEEFYDVMLKCWQHSPDNRPSFEELSVILRQILEEQERTYINITYIEEHGTGPMDTKL